MKIVFLAHMWCPVHNAGGETTVHAACRELVRRGHEVTVICCPQQSEERKFDNYEHEGVRVFKSPTDTTEQDWIRKRVKDVAPDLLMTHLDLTVQAMQLSIDLNLPLAHWIHNTMSIGVFHIIPRKCQLAIFNSHWVADYHQWPGRQIVIYPIVEPERYTCERGTKITLINPTPGKGADTLYRLSKLLPEYEFLVVKSVYGEQIAPPNINGDLYPNVEVMEHTADIREAFRKTRVLVMPSIYESYGRVGVEAACSGIPTIAHPTPGLRESLGSAGIFYDREDVASWAWEIERLYTDDVYYRKRSDAALALAESLDPESEFNRLEEALLVTLKDWNQKPEDGVKMWTSDRRLYYDKDRNITTDRSQAVSLCCGVGGQIPMHEAVRLGLTKVDQITEYLLGGPEEAEAKRLKEPEENKAFAAPEENKQRRRKRVA